MAALLLTACEKGLVEDMEGVGNGQAANSVLQVRTRAGGANADAATVSYPVTVYVFQGSECRAASATATLIDGGTNTVTLGMERKTMFLQDVTIKKIPTAATAVSVTSRNCAVA